MNARRAFELCMVTGLTVGGPGLGLDKASAAQPGPVGVEAGVQVLTRGPVHEAFAETITFNPEPGMVVSNAAPKISAERQQLAQRGRDIQTYRGQRRPKVEARSKPKGQSKEKDKGNDKLKNR